VISRASDPFADDIAARQTARADAAHQHLVALADGLKGIGADSYMSDAPRLLALLGDCGTHVDVSHCYGDQIRVTKASRVVEGVRLTYHKAESVKGAGR
jgi:Mg-chelatase subunit ChlD